MKSINNNRCVGILGGTFDPIHYGHLRTALELRERLGLAHIKFIPCNDPPTSKSPLMNAMTRLRMVEVATESEEGFIVDTREIDRGGVSFTVDTLASLRDEFPYTPFALIMGMDAFLTLPTWHNWQRIFTYAHLVVAHRPGWQTPAEDTLGALIAQRTAANPAALHTELGGYLFVAAVTQLEISSTDLRASISAGIDPKYLVTPGVRSIILELECYAKETHA